MELTIRRAGMQTSVQDLGRRGFRSAGVPLSGAMDPFAARVANLLVGNTEPEAVLEFTLVGPDIEFSEDALISVTGAECENVPSWTPMVIRAGEVLSCGPCIRGCYGYVAVAGRIEIESVMGSRSTYLRGGWGGFLGRALQSGDKLKVERLRKLPRILQGWRIDQRILPAYHRHAPLRVMRGGQGRVIDSLVASEFSVTARSDRMGLRLSGPVLASDRAGELTSAALIPGTVQVPPDGQPVVLMADAQTIGGYPQVAHVINVDLPLAAQLRPGDPVHFREVQREEAHRLQFTREHAIAMLREGLSAKWAAGLVQ
jgi:antagonist of KipI